MACFNDIGGWYNPARLRSGLGYRSPMTYEAVREAALTEPWPASLETVHENGVTSEIGNPAGGRVALPDQHDAPSQLRPIHHRTAEEGRQVPTGLRSLRQIYFSYIS